MQCVLEHHFINGYELIIQKMNKLMLLLKKRSSRVFLVLFTVRWSLMFKFSVHWNGQKKIT